LSSARRSFPDKKLRLWHVFRVIGLVGVVVLVTGTPDDHHAAADSVFYLTLVGIAAALWGYTR
jgi:hypothetical protein